ncbi:MAG TPA: hypothetical protein VG846_00175, partial [Actinomycetota bacterium]|nr:hypothetical protein [Actinomycetota bacterium]
PAGTDPARAAAILVNESKWVNHTVLHYYFFDRETDGEHVFGADGTRVWRPWTTNKAHQDVVRTPSTTGRPRASGWSSSR